MSTSGKTRQVSRQRAILGAVPAPATATGPSTSQAISPDAQALLASLEALPGSLPGSPILVRLTALPRGLGWRLELSEDDGGTWSSLSPVFGYPTPGEAIQAGSEAITLWRSSRVEATQAEIGFFFSSGKLERGKIEVIDEETKLLKEIDGFKALSSDGKWLEAVSPIEAIRKAKGNLS